MSARRSKIVINPLQPGLFDNLEGLPRQTPRVPVTTTMPDIEAEIHPSIHDFAVKARSAAPLPLATTDADGIEPLRAKHREEPLLFISFGSGSSGNCAYLGTRREGILIDAGVDPAFVEKEMSANSLSMANVRGILLTHDHSDHVRFVYKLVRLRKDTAIYCTPKTLTGLLRRHNISRRVKDYHHPIYKEFPFELAGMTLTAFDVSHDGTDNCGFFIEAPGQTFAVATDIGSITPRVDFYMRKANYVMLEANYDAEMLRTGPYTAFLKSRIAAPNGHLDNLDSAEFAATIAAEGNLSHIFLCHLSAENNTPETALAAVKARLESSGFGPVGDASGSIEASACPIQLMALPRTKASRLFLFRRKKSSDPKSDGTT
ncbi:MAG: MBL fold metallo-hydrolase [Pseudoflavonifractor sp.]|nr:MBL fold metallo-hydrolase [Alloprevotella sp.]MCM1117401.1 MBL fold metallo-hydrolase [Pseudoflavonifractor sp.]